jgi:hypothetical protein
MKFTREIQLSLFGIVAAHAIATLTVGGITKLYLGVFFISFFITVFALHSLATLISKKTNLELMEAEEIQEALKTRTFPLSIEEAKIRAEKLLRDANKFQVTPATHAAAKNEALKIFAPHLREFCSKYDTVSEVYGDFKFSGDSMGPSNIDKRFIKIADDLEFSEFVAKAGEETIYWLDSSFGAQGSRGTIALYPSIYHLILVLGEA